MLSKPLHSWKPVFGNNVLGISIGQGFWGSGKKPGNDNGLVPPFAQLEALKSPMFEIPGLGSPPDANIPLTDHGLNHLAAAYEVSAALAPPLSRVVWSQ